ncbi:type IV pilus modification PilV family protein [Kribbella deserti]|uniref:Prepilin-type N-terminal cleavage/methylation domain-containing protein n=1 Tax=Kribbella deserti TaxID=1926257 RepID=A0ABV6QWM2_9ACTN
MRRNERGESLLELMIAVALMGVALVALMAGVATTIIVSDTQRKQATAATTVRDYAEALQAYVGDGNYRNCATTYAVPGFAPPPGFTARVVPGSVQYWTGLLWLPLCLPDSGLQRLKVVVSSADGRVEERLDLVLRKPCRVEDPLCG